MDFNKQIKCKIVKILPSSFQSSNINQRFLRLYIHIASISVNVPLHFNSVSSIISFYTLKFSHISSCSSVAALIWPRAFASFSAFKFFTFCDVSHYHDVLILHIHSLRLTTKPHIVDKLLTVRFVHLKGMNRPSSIVFCCM